MTPEIQISDEIRDQYMKALRVVRSCKTGAQLIGALYYLRLWAKKVKPEHRIYCKAVYSVWLRRAKLMRLYGWIKKAETNKETTETAERICGEEKEGSSL